MVGAWAHMQEGIREDSLPARSGGDTTAAARQAGPHVGVTPKAGQRQEAVGQQKTGQQAGQQEARTARGSALTRDSIRNDAAAPADSLAAQVPGDSLTGFGQPDSTVWNGTGYLFPGDTAGYASEPVIWRDTTAEAVFGTASVRVDARRTDAAVHDIPTDNAPFQCFVLLLAITYAVLLYRNLGDIRTLLSRTFQDTSARKRLTEDSGGSGFTRFLNITTAIGLLFLGLLTVKFGGERIDGLLPEHLEGIAVLGLSLATTLAAGIVVAYQRAILWSAGAITVTQPFILQLLQLRRTYFALIVVTAAPVLLLFILCPPHTGTVWLKVMIAESAIGAILYLKESLSLFLSKNFSILHWFLYLCIVELFPISLLWLLLTRAEASI